MACPCIIATDWLGVLIRLDIPLDNKDNVLSVEYSTQPSQLRKDNITKKKATLRLMEWVPQMQSFKQTAPQLLPTQIRSCFFTPDAYACFK